MAGRLGGCMLRCELSAVQLLHTDWDTSVRQTAGWTAGRLGLALMRLLRIEQAAVRHPSRGASARASLVFTM